MIEVICGSMFSGKTEELIRRLKRASIAKQKVLILKPLIDTRYSETDIVTHDGYSIPAISIKKSKDIFKHKYHNYDVIGIDEVQFFDDGLVDIVQKFADDGIRVIVSGLDMDYQRKPFGIVPKLLSIAEKITKLHAVCTDCGEDANFSFRTEAVDGLVILGEKNNYKALCRKCYLRNFNF